MTLKEFKGYVNGSGRQAGFIKRAAEDIPGGYAKAGDALYGDCGDMEVVRFAYNYILGAYVVYLKEVEL